MFHSSSSASYTESAFLHSSGPPSLAGASLTPYYDAATSAALFDATSTTLSSSLPSNNYLMHRSSSSQSFAHHQTCSVPDPASAYDLPDFHLEPFRRVFSTGDLQVSTENCIQEGIVSAGQVGRYSAEERMKRIERYRNKRNQRNFHKKITYACRKTLADSRPRVRGRFARNGEPETETEPESSETTSYDSYKYSNSNQEKCGSYSNHDNIDNGGTAGEWWSQMQAALLTTTGEEESGSIDEDLWANLDSVFSMNLLS